MADRQITFHMKGTGDFSNIKSQVQQLQSVFNKIQLPDNIDKNLKSTFSNLEKEMAKYQRFLDSGFKTKGDVTGLEKSGATIERLIERLQGQVDGIDFSSFLEGFTEVQTKIGRITNGLQTLRQTLNQKLQVKLDTNDEAKDKIKSIIDQLDTLRKHSSSEKIELFSKALESGDIERIQEAYQTLISYGETLGNDGRQNAEKFNAALAPIVQSVSELFSSLSKGDAGIQKLQKDIETTRQNLEQAGKEGEKIAHLEFSQARTSMKEVSTSFKEMKENAEETAHATQDLNSNFEHIKSRVGYFLSIAGAARIARQAIRDLWQGTQELDKAMTETAVVTDFTVGDMWDKLPEYTENAKALGIATKELYEATTLYYQQGLKGNEVMNIGVETLKLARISGLEAAQATDLMTTALRGFNMEINETSAQNISDTYAALAASSASNVQELATAMSKTASLAAGVGADFKNIAVFLAQGIETTRESADTIGTAMKTVLARFNEMKKDPAEVMDVEGEEVNVNRVEAALRSAGITLRDVNEEFRAADDVLMEVAERWKSLSIMQQRYIATQAAGSRQQSRFIAMMSDYNRTLELQQIAYNSTGAAEKQFEKTQESLQTKVQRLKDNWQEFVLGLLNSDSIKGIINVLNLLVGTINKMSALPGILGSVSKGLLALGAVKGALGLGNVVTKAMAEAKDAFEKDGNNVASAFVSSFAKQVTDKFKGIKLKIDAKPLLKDAERAGTEYTEEFLKAQKARQVKKDYLSKHHIGLDKFNRSAANAEKELSLGKTLSAGQKERLKIAKELEQAESDLANAKTAKINKSKEYIAALGLEEKQQAAANAMVEEGVTVDVAAQLAQSKVTIEDIKNAAVKDKLIASGMTEAAIQGELTAGRTLEQIAQTKGIVLTEEELRQKALEESLRKKGLVGRYQLLALKLREAIATHANTLAEELQNKGKEGSIRLTIAQKLANLGLIGSTVMLTAVIVAAVAAIAGLVWIFGKLYKAAKESTLEYQMEKSAQATGRAREAAEKANTAYSELLDKKSEFDEMQSGLNNMIKGTAEWNQALLENNKTILDLIDQFKELSPYLTIGKNGELTIRAEGWEEANKVLLERAEAQGKVYTKERIEDLNYQKAVANTDTFIQTKSDLALQAVAPSGADVVAVGGIDLSPIGELFSGVKTNTIETNLSKEIRDAISDAGYKSFSDLADKTEEVDKIIEQVANSLGISIETVRTEFARLTDTESALESYDQTIKTLEKTLFNNADFLKDNKYKDELATGLAVVFEDGWTAAVDSAKKNYEGKSEADLVKAYQGIIHENEDAIRQHFSEDGKFSKEAIIEDLAEFDASKELQDKSKEIVENFNKFQDETTKKIAAALLSGGENLTSTELTDMVGSLTGDLSGGIFDIEELKKIYKELFPDLDDEQVDEALAKLKINAENYQAKLEEYKNTLIKKGSELFTDDDFKKLTAEQIKNIYEQYTQVITYGSDEAKRAYKDFIDNVNKLEDNFDETIKKQIFGLSSNDLSNLAKITNLYDFRKGLQDLGVDISNLTNDEIYKLQEEIKNVGNGIKNLNVAQIGKDLVNLNSAREKIKEVTDKKNPKVTVSAEEKAALINTGIATESQFVKGTKDGEFKLTLDKSDIVNVLQSIDSKVGELAKNIQGDAEEARGIVKSASIFFGKGATLSEAAGKIEGLEDNDNNEQDLKSLTLRMSKQLGLDPKEINAMDFDQLKSLLLQYFQSAATQAAQDLIAQGPDAALAQYTSVTTSEGEKKEAQDAIITQAQQYGIATDLIDEYKEAMAGTDEDAANFATRQLAQLSNLYQSAQAWGLNTEELSAYAKQLQKTNAAIKGNDVLATQLAKRFMNMNAGIKTLHENWEDWNEVLVSGKKDSSEYIQVQQSIKSATEQLLDTTVPLSDQFLETEGVMNLVAKAAEGDADAINELAMLASQDIFETIIGTNNIVGETEDERDTRLEKLRSDYDWVKNYLESNPIKPGATVDNTKFIEHLNQMVQAANMTEDQVTSLLGNMGMNAELVTEYKEVTAMKPVTLITRTPKPQSDGSIAWEERSKVEDYEPVTETVPVVAIKSVSGSYASGGNINVSSTKDKGGKKSSSKSSNTYEPDTDPLYNEKQKLTNLDNKRTKAESEYNKELAKEIPNVQKLIDLYNQITETNRQRLEQTKVLRDASLREISDLENANSDLLKYAHYDENTHTVYQDVDAISALKGTDEEFGKRLDQYIKKLEEFANQYNEYDQNIDELEEEILEREKRTNEIFERHLNELAELAAKEREANKLQDEYNAILRRRVTRSQDLYKNQQEQLVVMDDIIKSREKYLELVQTDWNSYYEEKVVAAGAQNVITFDENVGPLLIQEELERLPDNLQQIFKDIFDRFKERFDDVISAQEELAEAEKKRSEFLNDALQSALEGIAKIRELIVAEYQEAIDSLSTVNESINSSNSKLLDGIQKNISQLRQDRENEKTEKDLRDKEAQLAYLMQDTTGANLQKIKELQEQLDEGKQSYTDTLIDQKISELQEQNDEAAEQRQEQIDLMTDWLDLYQKSGLINKEIQEAITQGLGEQGEVIVGSRLDTLINKYGIEQGLTRDEIEAQLKPIKEDMQNITQIYGNDIENGVGPLMDDYAYKSSDARRALRIAAKLEEPTEQDYERFDLDEDGKISAADAQYILKMAARLITRSDIPKKRYATGGLADYTGPAWLDGTSTNPELVLNAQDTQNFIMLKDILASILNSTSGVNAVNSGDNYFDIHIEVEKIESDYDVDQMADRIKNIIRDDAMYRNVNIINQW